eukprot:scaffold17539_cov182-Skeletonema_marinoi.AAC.3
MDASNDDVSGDNGDIVTAGTTSQSSSLEQPSDGERQLLNSICDSSNLASSDDDHNLSNSVFSAGAFSRIGNSLSSGSHSESYTDTPTAAVDEDDGDDRLILNETFERLGSKLMQDCVRTPIEDTTCSDGDRREGESNGTNCNVENGQTPRTHNKSKSNGAKSAIDGDEIPTHLNLPNDDENDNAVDDCLKSPEQRRLESEVKRIEAEIAEAQHSLEEEEQAQNQTAEASTRLRTSVDEDILMASGAVKSLQKQMEEADANVYVLNSVSDIGDIDEHHSGEINEAVPPLSPVKSSGTKRSIDNGNVRAPSTPSPRKQSTRKDQQLPPKSPIDNSSLLSRGISMLRNSKQVTPTSRRTRGMDNDNSSVVSDITRGDLSPRANKFDDGTLKRHLEESGLLLLKRLIEFLSECPPAQDEDAPIVPSRGRSPAGKQRKKLRGLTLPATAIGWISHQIIRFDSIDNSESNIEAFEDTEDGYFVPKHQLQCVQFLLRRVVSVRISGEPWPPQAATKKATSANRSNQAGLSSRILSKFASDQSAAGESAEEDSCGTSIYDEKEKNLSPFQRYYHELQSKPHINMEIFPNATKVVIDGIPPNWVINLDSLKNLDMFQMEKGCLLDINQLFFPSDVPIKFSERHLSLIEEDNAKERHHFNTDTCVKKEQQPFVYSSLSKLRLSNCAIGEISGLRGRSKRSARQYQSTSFRPKKIPPFSRFPNLVSLNLSHNEIFRTKSAFAGLSSLPMLSSINLSYNRLSRLDDVFMHIGNVTELILTGNEISTTRGIDRLFSLERLSLSENKIHNLSDIAGVANLPFLMKLDLKENPLMEDDTSRIKVLNLFREVRCKNLPKNATYRDMQNLLPVLDDEVAMKDELVALKDFTFRPTVIPPSESLTSAPVSSQNDRENTADKGESIVIDTAAEISVNTPSKAGGLRRIQKDSTSRSSKVRVAGSLLLDDNAARRLGRFHTHLQQRKSKKQSEAKVSVKFSTDDLLISIRPDIDHGMSAIENDGDYLRRSRLLSKSYMSQCSRNEDVNKTFEDDDNMFPYSLPASLLEEASDDAWIPSLQADRITPAVAPAVLNEIEYSINDSPQHETDELDDVVTARVSFSGNTHFRSMYETDHQNEEDNNDRLNLVEGPTTGMFDSIWEESYQKNPNKDTVLESDQMDGGTNTQPLDFQAAEQDAQYDGPLDYSLLSVSRDLDLYFDSYVFPNDPESDGNDARQNVIAPRIQMYKFDRDSLTNSRKRDQELNPMGGDISERYLGVWREGVLACGPYARKRLAPVRLQKRGFHGDTIMRGGKEVAVSESRRYILCLSDTALYFIVDDEFSTRKNTSKRTFPSRISPNATFGDAQWPHAVVRHSLDSLKRIVIGFQFQRLTLQFFVSNGVSSSSFEYTYVVLTSNKAQTVSLLQKLQSYVSDTQPDSGFRIENDDKLFLDGLGANSSEIVTHYQIVHQVWKTGNREAARRSFVLTDSKIYLLDEIYFGDGTNGAVEKSRRINLGDVSLAIIDEAKLSKVTEVRAANEDPRMITLVILPANKLKRGHRWRLVCNDGESAERLIDDVRNACQR